MELPLVTVFIITYNSSEFILEGLESVKAQTYPNIELVISDDCSSDNTVKLCSKWLEENAKYFKNTVLITSPVNTGVAPNCNRAIQASSGQWLKILAGDDRLLPNAISDYIEYIQGTPEAKICASKVIIECPDPKYKKELELLFEKYSYPLFKLDQKSMYKYILKQNFIPAPTLFFKKGIWQSLGGFNESYPFLEDYPFTIQAIKKGYHIYFIDKALCIYNVHEGSLSQNTSKLSIKSFSSFYNFFSDVKWKLMINNGLLFDAYHEFLTLKIESLSFSHKASLKKNFYKLLFLSDPIYYKKKLSKNLRIK